MFALINRVGFVLLIWKTDFLTYPIAAIPVMTTEDL